MMDFNQVCTVAAPHIERKITRDTVLVWIFDIGRLKPLIAYITATFFEVDNGCFFSLWECSS
ncbi:hypothetical protein BDF21DRAFT_464633 [Thamnidium elegans]|nr:hypothetical protein BDF21DRAFT_464633 [Thamnidium elegans]